MTSVGSGTPETVANAEQLSAWDGDEGRHWVENQERHDTMLRRLTPHLLAAANIEETSRVLDLGCGCGETTCLAAKAASRGSAVGVDLSAAMLERARDGAAAKGLVNVSFLQADAQVHPFPSAAFDVAISRFGVMFFADAAAAFANITAALRPAGRLAFLCWQELRQNQWLSLIGAAIAAHVQLGQALASEGPGPFSLADPDRIRTLLTSAGLRAVEIAPVSEPVRLGADVDDVLTYFSGMPMVRSMLADVDKASAARGVDAIREALRPFQTAEGVVLGSAAWLVTAER